MVLVYYQTSHTLWCLFFPPILSLNIYRHSLLLFATELLHQSSSVSFAKKRFYGNIIFSYLISVCEASTYWNGCILNTVIGQMLETTDLFDKCLKESDAKMLKTQDRSKT